MIWAKITKKQKRPPLAVITEGEERIKVWDKVYRGVADWLEYHYQTLAGTKMSRTRKSMKSAKLVTREMASLIWAERPKIEADQSVLDILNRGAFDKNIQAKTDRMLALGGMAILLYVKDNVIKFDFVPAGRFIPVSWDNKRVYEADFIDRKVHDGKPYVRIESHRVAESGSGYDIKQAVYEEQKGGALIPAKLSIFKIEQESVFVPTMEPMFVYIKNPEENNFSPDSPLGISMYGNALDTIESIDIAFDALQSEIVLGRKRIIVPAESVRTITDPETGNQHRYFDPSDEVYQAFDMADVENMKIIDNTVSLRIGEIKEAIQTLLNIFSIQVGFSAGFISFDDIQGMKTATEIVSENSKTFKTKKTYENAIGEGIVQLCNSIRALGINYGVAVSSREYSVVWEDSIIEDRNSKASYWINRYSAGVASLADVLRALDGLSPEEAEAKAEKIKAENATINLNSMFGGSE